MNIAIRISTIRAKQPPSLEEGVDGDTNQQLAMSYCQGVVTLISRHGYPISPTRSSGKCFIKTKGQQIHNTIGRITTGQYKIADFVKWMKSEIIETQFLPYMRPNYPHRL